MPDLDQERDPTSQDDPLTTTAHIDTLSDSVEDTPSSRDSGQRGTLSERSTHHHPRNPTVNLHSHVHRRHPNPNRPEKKRCLGVNPNPNRVQSFFEGNVSAFYFLLILDRGTNKPQTYRISRVRPTLHGLHQRLPR